MAADGKKKKNLAVDLLAGGTAGLFEALVCHPLDTIKVRMQLTNRQPGVKEVGFVQTGIKIAKKEGPLALYKGLGAVVTGIVPKMAIRFTSYEYYRGLLTKPDGTISAFHTFIAGVGAGTTEAVLVVNPTEVIKIRLQAQHHSMADPLDVPKYRNAAHCLYTVVREEGPSALYRGVVLTATRQATNQGVNFTVYSELKARLNEMQPQFKGVLPSWQTSIIGLISGALGPLSNAPIDTIKTRMQREGGAATRNESGLSRFTRITRQLIQQEGVRALYKGITPRIMRVAPGQAVTFTVYEYMRGVLENTPGIGKPFASQFEE
ncbi:Succinate/fumarate mitochondrial transporter [Yarrowia sp. C11]|nr:Succinate/fumarate mitochondrial transporter [Yarrowia sp. C11]KAG5371241.1 Succinate/fumarate mitochondrial transporter [Yarrowia sp. E02]